ncbi:polysaccharide biosynthesis protein [Oryzobacter terrae]|uniref:polysaccharide biosynthesis protein n=1 Tax=Oryzobacter terrae TaxID=1620385 RepID=UPI00366BF9B7
MKGASERVRSSTARLAWGVVDGVIWAVAVVAATFLRFQYDLDATFVANTFIAAGAAAAAHFLIGLVVGPYRRGVQRGSFDEVRDLAVTTGIVTLLLFAVTVSLEMTRPELDVLLPGTVPPIAGLAAYSVQMATRLLFRTHHQRRATRRENSVPVIVFGAGSAARLLVRSLLHDDKSPYHPVALLDDDRSKRRHRLEGLKVRGTRADIEQVARSTGATQLVIAIPSATAQTVRELRTAAEKAGVHPLVVPPMSQVIGRGLTARDIRDINLADLLGRHPVHLDESAIARQLTGRVVLVTGAGGSIGAELCRQISRYNPARLVLLDRDESALHAVQLDLDGEGLLQNDNIVLADIRDLPTLRARFAEHEPEVVFHAAALKHLPLLERFPSEAWQSNVLGTLNVLTASAEFGVETFVNISTDKAADPTSVLGYSKRLAERLTAGFAQSGRGRYISVRFGNVLGSRGSVVPAFTAQIQQGGPVTITDPDVERYFMLIPEACQLVMQAAAIGSSGEVLVLDMGEQVKILELAETLIAMADRPGIEIRFTGLRPGEKLSEELFSLHDEHRSTDHPLVMATDVPPIGARVVSDLHPIATEVHSVLVGLAAVSREVQPSMPGSATDLSRSTT